MPGSSPRQAKAAPSSGRSVPVRGSPAQVGPDLSGDFPVVGIGASAGGLDACRKLVDAMPLGVGMAFILVQHLDPTHESMMVALLASHTTMTVLQATDGMTVERDHLYVIPPGVYLSVSEGALRLSQPTARHGARLPVDFLLHSLAEEYGARGVCVILSGTGPDGSLGARAVKENGGLVVAQDPGEAQYDGMPRTAIMTGTVDLVLPVAMIPDALVRYTRQMALAGETDEAVPRDEEADCLPGVIELLKAKTPHDFRLYKEGTLRRRIARRMAMAGVEIDEMGRYLELVRRDENELDLLAKDLLINVTSFFRDPGVFDLLAKKIVPDLVRGHTADLPLRIWNAGCSTGEETYSLVMVFREAITAAKLNIKLQVFASDVDPDAVARARDGLYPETIAAEISPARLARFFSKEESGYRVSPELRTPVIFTVQDVLADPPFSRLDLVSCRNLLIYLRSEAQARAISLFHFALRDGGILLLGGSETAGNVEGRFEVISKSARIYRHIGRSRPGEFGFLLGTPDSVRVFPRPAQPQAPSRQAALAELCRKLVLETHAPAAVLIDSNNECIYSLGPTDRYLRVPPGHPTHNLLAMAPQRTRTKLRSAIQRASQENARAVVTGGRIDHNGGVLSFSIDVQPVSSERDTLFLVCFIDEPMRESRAGQPAAASDTPRVVELELELDATRMELQGAIRNLELSSEEQKGINQEALSVNEEFQAANEELLTSKEELQSLNEELTALNSQLQETLERQRTTANDLQNILYSTDVATIFLDVDLNIRFFTPATKSVFSIIPSDVGRPLADLNSLAADGALMIDAGTVLRTHAPLEREIQSPAGAWYIRRILPYHTQDDSVEGVVITFVDVTERRHSADAVSEAKRQADLANAAKSRFLAAASHDLRQPLQTLALLQGLMIRAVDGDKARNLVARMEEATAAMSGMLNTLLDINQIEAGAVTADRITFPINKLLDRLRDAFSYNAQAQGLELRAVPCGLSVYSDPRLLEQIIRNLLANALKYTKRGKVLIGCRRHGDMLRIEVWDTGIGIPDDQIEAIFDEYHQLDNAERERSRGLGLGLSIVQRLGNLLGHRISVRSTPGKGSVFAIEVPFPTEGQALPPRDQPDIDDGIAEAGRRAAAILVVEDDPEVRGLLEILLRDEGHCPVTTHNGPAALELVARGMVRPELILADYNLPGGLNGLELAVKLRKKLHRETPVIILTGDISTGTLRDIASRNCQQLNKPVKSLELIRAIQNLLPRLSATALAPDQARPPEDARSAGGPPVIFVVDDDNRARATIRAMLEDEGRIVEDYQNCEDFLDAYRPGGEACLLIDAYLPGMTGLELLKRLGDDGNLLPSIMITGDSDVPMVVQALQAGASDFMEKPVGRSQLLAGIDRALEQSRDAGKLTAWRDSASSQVAELTPRQRQIMDLVLAGHPSKNIAADLGISQRTVENHRAAIMRKTGSKSVPALARLAIAATWNRGGGS